MQKGFDRELSRYIFQMGQAALQIYINSSRQFYAVKTRNATVQLKNSTSCPGQMKRARFQKEKQTKTKEREKKTKAKNPVMSKIQTGRL